MPQLPFFADSDFVTALVNLLPNGEAWDKQPNSPMVQTLTPYLETSARLSLRATNLIVDAFPPTTVELLHEWEESLGLPDPCQGIGPSVEARRAQVVARFLGGGGQSIPFLISYALNLGYTITITEFGTFRAGWSRAGDPLNDERWAYALQINAVLDEITYFRAGQSAAGDPLATWSNAVLECELRRIAPAEAILIFAYS